MKYKLSMSSILRDKRFDKAERDGRMKPIAFSLISLSKFLNHLSAPLERINLFVLSNSILVTYTDFAIDDRGK